MAKLICCICGKEIDGFGNNPDGAAWKKEDGSVEFASFKPHERCCNSCNGKYVVPGRIYRFVLAKRRNKDK